MLNSVFIYPRSGKIADLYNSGYHFFTDSFIFMEAIRLKLEELVFIDVKGFTIHLNRKLTLYHKDIFINISLMRLRTRFP